MSSRLRAFVLSMAFILSLAACSTASAQDSPAAPQSRPSVLMISIDGMRPDYVTHADQHHLRIPNLRRLLTEGTYAEGVTGVFPTVTYPSHTTLVTGVWPAEHGVANNTRFDPERDLAGAWYWYADQIKVPTLWDAAHGAGLVTASVGWPVTVDATSIDYLVPEYWRSALGETHNADDRFLIGALSRPDGELARITARTRTPYMTGNSTNLADDEIKTVYSLDILQQHRPRFMTLHLSSLDEEEHLHGPFSPEANQDLEALDGMVGRLVAQELKNDPAAAVVIVSDHGFADVTRATNLYIPFLQAGLIQTTPPSSGELKVTSWKAEPWLAGGLAAVMLKDPADASARDTVLALLNKLAADPNSGIAEVLTHEQISALGGFPDAAFAVTLKTGYVTGAALSGALVSPTQVKGTHGYNPATTPEMRASFFISGQGIARGRNLGLIDMRQVAPTLAGLLGVNLPAAAQPALPIR